MAIELEYDEGNMSWVVVPEGTRPYADSTLRRNRDFLREVYRSGNRDPEGLGQVAEKYQKTLTSVERAYYRVVRIMSTRSPVDVLNSLRM